MSTTDPETTIQALLRALANPSVDKLAGFGRESSQLSEEMVRQLGVDDPVSQDVYRQAVWAIVSRELAYISFRNETPAGWHLFLTDRGKAAARDEEFNPDSPDHYMERLRERIPDEAKAVHRYANEALSTYLHREYLASAVMLGVASEAAFLDMASAFRDWDQMTRNERDKFGKLIDGNRRNYIDLFEEFRKRLAKYRGRLPDDLSDNLTLTFDAVLDVLRIYRNEAGHPTGKVIDREDAFINLQMFARYVSKLYQLKHVFQTES